MSARRKSPSSSSARHTGEPRGGARHQQCRAQAPPSTTRKKESILTANTDLSPSPKSSHRIGQAPFIWCADGTAAYLRRTASRLRADAPRACQQSMRAFLASAFYAPQTVSACGNTKTATFGTSSPTQAASQHHYIPAISNLHRSAHHDSTEQSTNNRKKPTARAVDHTATAVAAPLRPDRNLNEHRHGASVALRKKDHSTASDGNQRFVTSVSVFRA